MHARKHAQSVIVTLGEKEEILGMKTPYPAAYLPVGHGYDPAQAKLEQRRIEHVMGFARHGFALVRKKALKEKGKEEKKEAAKKKGKEEDQGKIDIKSLSAFDKPLRSTKHSISL